MKKSISKNHLQYEEIIIKIIIENWRFIKLYKKVISKLNPIESQKYLNQIRYFQKVIDENLRKIGLKIVNLEGHPYDTGIPAVPLNIEEFNSQDRLYIKQMIEPLIMKDNEIKKQATVILAKEEK